MIWRHRKVGWAVLVYHLQQAWAEWRDYVIEVRRAERATKK